MTDDEMIERLERYAGYLEGSTPTNLTTDQIARLVALDLRCVARRLKNTGFDRIPKLISELAFRGGGFPPQNGIN